MGLLSYIKQQHKKSYTSPTAHNKCCKNTGDGDSQGNTERSEAVRERVRGFSCVTRALARQSADMAAGEGRTLSSRLQIKSLIYF